MAVKQRLCDLRALMQKEGVQGYIVPTADAHQSEYTPDQDKQRQFISGFTGSAGIAVVGINKAWLWTDGRYWNQANLELSEDWELMKQGLPTTPLPEEYIAKNFPAGSVTGVDPRLLSIPQANDFSSALHKSNQQIKYIPHNLVDQVWKDKPEPSIKHCIVLSDKLSGRSVNDKLEWIRKEMSKRKSDLLIITALDDIAWLLNIRGFDIPYNPVLISYAIISSKDVKIYVDQRKLSDDVKAHFVQHSIIPLEYSTFFSDLEKLADAKLNIWVDANGSIAVYNALKPENKNERQVIVEKSPIILEKALKNPVELNGFRESSTRDAVALVKFFSWLEKELNSPNGDKLTEHIVAEVLLKFRQDQAHFLNASFATISSSGSNAAIIHYHPTEKQSSKIVKDQIFLCDSGGQYMDGTTDVTRSWHFGTPKDKEKLAFTCVLKGVINLSLCVFPNNTTGLQLDALARTALWEYGLDFRHGTGHGVGHFLNVHEGPHQISFRARAFEAPIKEHMTVTNEPGYYDMEFLVLE